MYKVFIYNKPIFFLETSEVSALPRGTKTFVCENAEDRESLLSLHRNMDISNPVYVVNANLKELMKLFFQGHKKIEAAGGIVENNQKEILFIERLGYWDLPKGKVEKNEELKEAAVREIEEECGIVGPVIQKKLLKTFHTYSAKGKKYFKITHWYLLKYDGNDILLPQEEEGITEVRWVDPRNMMEQLSRTYNSILDVLDFYMQEWED
ncbi:MAG: NUDIX domain-containing protein [Flavobacteriales bacterium]|nr:NUDIX domain-containing protein [Flavobacteriales bacterium]MCB9195754.1 NUDIX domain-containing protein [Flavobacteriales bacterium]MCB9198808.1 NUDIX domain-containing protein [Flavobacteriales bacterium]